MMFSLDGALFLYEPLNVGDLLLWQEVHPGLDVETWAWCENGLGCIQNGLVCVVRYKDAPFPESLQRRHLRSRRP